eukprot:TRINITY_DN10662_c0_g2_i3.p1 TRINITY_DN10662_c0_g2~~TRINITY_DN10662_c0_g2_i3.p1  ORF type:complete len:369 (+),score=85.16 TRINITY_DN10662_c0_g2_i3:202-1308(+)
MGHRHVRNRAVTIDTEVNLHVNRSSGTKKKQKKEKSVEKNSTSVETRRGKMKRPNTRRNSHTVINGGLVLEQKDVLCTETADLKHENGDFDETMIYSLKNNILTESPVSTKVSDEPIDVPLVPHVPQLPIVAEVDVSYHSDISEVMMNSQELTGAQVGESKAKGDILEEKSRMNESCLKKFDQTLTEEKILKCDDNIKNHVDGICYELREINFNGEEKRRSVVGDKRGKKTHSEEKKEEKKKHVEGSLDRRKPENKKRGDGYVEIKNSVGEEKHVEKEKTKRAEGHFDKKNSTAGSDEHYVLEEKNHTTRCNIAEKHPEGENTAILGLAEGHVEGIKDENKITEIKGEEKKHTEGKKKKKKKKKSTLR